MSDISVSLPKVVSPGQTVPITVDVDGLNAYNVIVNVFGKSFPLRDLGNSKWGGNISIPQNFSGLGSANIVVSYFQKVESEIPSVTSKHVHIPTTKPTITHVRPPATLDVTFEPLLIPGKVVNGETFHLTAKNPVVTNVTVYVLSGGYFSFTINLRNALPNYTYEMSVANDYGAGKVYSITTDSNGNYSNRLSFGPVFFPYKGTLISMNVYDYPYPTIPFKIIGMLQIYSIPGIPTVIYVKPPA